MKLSPCIALSSALMLGGCANWNTAYRTHSTGSNAGDSISIDAKQRTVYTVRKDYGDGKAWTAVCAEPSPDALSALSANLGLDASTAGKALGLALATQEGAASIGLRTQSITILRDAMYRLCEGYASNALDEITYHRLMRRFQAQVIGLLAVEQLTGAVVAQQAQLGGQASGRLGQSLAQVTVMLQTARAEQAKAEAQAGAAQAASDAAVKAEAAAHEAYTKALAAAGGDEAKAQAEKDAWTKAAKDNTDKLDALGKAKTAAALAKTEVDSLEVLRKETDRAAVLASVAGGFGGAQAPARAASDATVNKVADTVQAIVTTVVQLDQTIDNCMDTFTTRAAGRLDPDALDMAAVFCAYAIETKYQRTADKGMANEEEATRKALSEARKAFVDKTKELTQERRARQASTGASAAPAKETPKSGG